VAVVPVPAAASLDESGLLGFAALAGSHLSTASANRLAGAVGRPSKTIHLQAQWAANVIQGALRTAEGQSLLYLLAQVVRANLSGVGNQLKVDVA